MTPGPSKWDRNRTREKVDPFLMAEKSDFWQKSLFVGPFSRFDRQTLYDTVMDCRK